MILPIKSNSHNGTILATNMSKATLMTVPYTKGKLLLQQLSRFDDRFKIRCEQLELVDVGDNIC